MSQSLRPTGKDIKERLETGQLPQMVDWFDPSILSMVAVRTLLSSTIGEYADQRPMQEAADGQRDMKRLSQRHDYSKFDYQAGKKKVFPPDADPGNDYYPKPEDYKDADHSDIMLMDSRKKRRLDLDKDGALWVDFIADLGDGFEATYAMAYLLAQPELEVLGVSRKDNKQTLPAGQILIFGGDLAYPNATEEEYRTRCLDPYNWAFQFTPVEGDVDKQEPKRELFFIAGNHDWYDGLAAFSTQFCYETSAIGGWRCSQQRSYFALQLPYNWWIWGIDVALGDSLDVAQRHYFEGIVAKRVEAGHRIIIMLHAPDWTKPHPEYKALSLVCQMAREKGEVCAIIAGDLHHYSRYQSIDGTRQKAEPGSKPQTAEEAKRSELHLITSGGGGAFAHPTHDQKSRLLVPQEVAGTGPVKKRAPEPRKRGIGIWPKGTEDVQFSAGAKQFYPTRTRSRLLAFQNLFLPIRNWRFAVFVGVVYMIFAWVFQIAVADPTVAIKNAQHVNIQMQCAAENPDKPDAARRCAATKKRAFDKKLAELTTVPEIAKNSAGKTPAKAAQDEVEDKFEKLLDDVDRQGGWWSYLWSVLSVQFAPDRVLSGMLASPAFFLLVAGLWVGLVQYAEVHLAAQWLAWPIKVVLGTAHAAAHLTVLLATNSLLTILYIFFAESPNFLVKVLGTGLYTGLMIIIGGVIGALVFGIYWVVTSVLFGMHQDSFSALGIRHYKNFLRMKVEENTLTIYPVALDKVPGRFGWKVSEEGKTGKGALIEPKKEMRPHLIETPIVIERAAVIPK